jgi:hypothetical protein
MIALAKAPPKFFRALLLAEIMAIVWWLVAIVAQNSNKVTIWFDQSRTFTQMFFNLRDPYVVPGFVNPPWTAIILSPFSLLPLPIATLIQTCLYFGLLTAVIFKFTGGRIIMLRRIRLDAFWITAIVLTSFIALDATLELNLEWIVCIGLLLPEAYTGPFLLVKPQDVLGILVSYKWRDLIRNGIVTLIVILAAFAIWGNWPLRYADALNRASYAKPYNIAPSAQIGWIPSVAIGVIAMGYAFRKRDPVLCALAWQCFVPYMTLYALLLPFALAVTRFPRYLLLISIAMWVIYGYVILQALTH